MTVRVAADVLREWRKQRAEGLEPAITMRLAAKGSADATRGVLNAVLDAVVEQRRSDEEPWRGEWSSVRSGRYVVVTVLECEVLDEVLPAIAAGL